LAVRTLAILAYTSSPRQDEAKNFLFLAVANSDAHGVSGAAALGGVGVNCGGVGALCGGGVGVGVDCGGVGALCGGGVGVICTGGVGENCGGVGVTTCGGGGLTVSVKEMRETNSPGAAERLESLASRTSFPPRRKRWKSGAAWAGGKKARSASLRSPTVDAPGRRMVVVRPSSARTGRNTVRWSFAAIAIAAAADGEGGPDHWRVADSKRDPGVFAVIIIVRFFW
jgi:hypothetical protein